MKKNDFLDYITTRVRYALIRWETELTADGGLAAVCKQERRFFEESFICSPFHSCLEANEGKNLQIEFTGISFPISGKTCRLLVTTDASLDEALPVPIVFFEIPGCFRGRRSVYAVPQKDANEDALWFGLAVERFIKIAEGRGLSIDFAWGADHQCVPALYRLKQNGYTVVLTLHNVYDPAMGWDPDLAKPAVPLFPCEYAAFYEKGDGVFKTALQIGLSIVDVASCVNRGFEYGLKTEYLYRHIMAPHLQNLVGKIIGIDNAAFTNLKENRDVVEILDAFRGCFETGRELLYAFKRKAKQRFAECLEGLVSGKCQDRKATDAIREGCTGVELTGEKVILMAPGRLVPQKQHDLVVAAIRKIFTAFPEFKQKLLVVFPVLPGDNDAGRLDLIKKLKNDFSENIIYYYGRCPFYGELISASNLNLMGSLYEPHGEALMGLVIPLARAIDGLSEQICDPTATGEADQHNRRWHNTFEKQTGFLWRESLHGLEDKTLNHDFRELLEGKGLSYHQGNKVFDAMTEALSKRMIEVVDLCINNRDAFSRIVCAALEKQTQTGDWKVNFWWMKKLIQDNL